MIFTTSNNLCAKSAQNVINTIDKARLMGYTVSRLRDSGFQLGLTWYCLHTAASLRCGLSPRVRALHIRWDAKRFGDIQVNLTVILLLCPMRAFLITRRRFFCLNLSASLHSLSVHVRYVKVPKYRFALPKHCYALVFK